MAHIFFERLEKRHSTQILFPTSGGTNSIQPVYGIQIPDTPWWGGTTGYTPGPITFYGISYPYGGITGGISPWTGGLFGMYGYSPFNNYFQRTNPFSSYNPWTSWGSGIFSPVWSFFGGLFGGGLPWSWGNNFPDFRLLYGIFPNPTPPTDIVTYYGIGIPSSFGLY